MVIGDQITTALMGWRWGRLPASRPQLSLASHQKDYAPPEVDDQMSTILTGFEPIFNAAEVITSSSSP